jgi:integrase
VHFDLPRADGLHLLRHSSGSEVHRVLGGDVKATQEWLGHSNSRVTWIPTCTSRRTSSARLLRLSSGRYSRRQTHRQCTGKLTSVH